MSRQVLFLNQERTCQYVIYFKMVLNSLMRKKPPLNGKKLNLNVASTRLNFTKDGSLNCNKKIEVHADTINKHQVSLLSCGGNAAFEANEEIENMISELHNDEAFSARRKAKIKGYNNDFYEVKFVRINRVVPFQNGYFQSETTKKIAGGAVLLGLDMVPIAGQIKAAREIYSGVDLITEFEVSWILSALALIPGGKLAAKSIGWFKST